MERIYSNNFSRLFIESPLGINDRRSSQIYMFARSNRARNLLDKGEDDYNTGGERNFGLLAEALGGCGGNS